MRSTYVRAGQVGGARIDPSQVPGIYNTETTSPSATAASCVQAFDRWLGQNPRFAIAQGMGTNWPPVTSDGWAIFLREYPGCARFAVGPGVFAAPDVGAATADACARAYQEMLRSVPRVALLMVPGTGPRVQLGPYETVLFQQHPECRDWLMSRTGRDTAESLAANARMIADSAPSPIPGPLPMPAPSPLAPPVAAAAVPWWLILLGGTVLGVAIARALR